MIDLANWMARLPAHKKATLTFTDLFVPGSHNSFTYSLDRDSEVGPDQSEAVRKWAGRAGFVARPIVHNWAVCQTWDVETQLENGVRFLDVRLGADVPKEPKCGRGEFGCDYAVSSTV